MTGKNTFCSNYVSPRICEIFVCLNSLDGLKLVGMGLCISNTTTGMRGGVCSWVAGFGRSMCLKCLNANLCYVHALCLFWISKEI